MLYNKNIFFFYKNSHSEVFLESDVLKNKQYSLKIHVKEFSITKVGWMAA